MWKTCWSKWVEEKEKIQAKAKDYEDPTYVSVDIPVQFVPIESLVVKLGRKPKPKPVKSETDTNSTTTTDEFNATSTNSTILEDDTNATTTTTNTTSTTNDDADADANAKEEIPAKGGIIDEL